MRRLLGQRPLVMWATLATLVVLAAGYFAFHALFVKVGRSVEQPFSGPARHDRYYVLRRYLEERGLHARSVRDWPQALPRDTLVLWFTAAPVPRDVRSWLADGGQLWSFRDPDTRSAGWTATPWRGEVPADAPAGAEPPDQQDATDDDVVSADAEETASADVDEAATDEPVAQQSADGAQPDDDTPEEGPLDDETLDDETLDDETLDEELTEAAWCAHGCLTAAQFRYGAGCLTLVRSGGLQNEQVFLGETPARIDALLNCPRRPASVLIVTSTGSPWFGQLLAEHAPEALLAFAVLLSLSLWRAGKHLGPKLPARTRERRQMLEHIGAVGTLAGRAGLSSMLEAARRELRTRLFKRVPQSASLSGEALIASVAQATELAPSDVQRALVDDPGTDSQAALAVARAIQALWRKT